MEYVSSIRNTQAGPAQRIAVFFRNLQEARGRRKVYNQTRNELLSLSNRELADLGIARSMISRIAHEAAYGK